MIKSPTPVTNWAIGANLASVGRMNDLASFSGIKIDDLVNTDLTAESDDCIIPISQTVKIPVLGQIACGNRIIAEEYIEEHRERPVSNFPNGELFYLKASGDSMEPVIPNENYVLIREQAVVENGEIAAVLVTSGAEATLKKIIKIEWSFVI